MKYIAGMRDKLIHEYHGVDLEIVWEVIDKEIHLSNPNLKNAEGVRINPKSFKRRYVALNFSYALLLGLQIPELYGV